MSNVWWRIRLVFWLIWYGYSVWWGVVATYRWSGEECWQTYREDGMSPRDSVLEDISYG